MEKARMRRRACSRPAGDREPQAAGRGQGVDTISKRFQLRAFLLVLLVAACASPQPPTSMVSAPDKLKPGASELLAMIVPAKGVQIYECRARKDQAGDTNGRSWLPKPIFSTRVETGSADTMPTPSLGCCLPQRPSARKARSARSRAYSA